MKFRLLNKSDWLRLVGYVKSLPKQRDDGAGITYVVTVEEMKSRRSLEQNARYWALLTSVSQQAPAYMGGEWHSPEVWHRYCATRFLGMESGPFGVGVPKSTSKLKVMEFCDYMTQVEAWAIDQFAGFDFDYEQRAAA